MSIVSEEEFTKATLIVEAYQRQQYKHINVAKVRLSKFGKEMQTPHNKVGKVINKRLAGMTDYTVEVLWSDGKKEWMHEHQVEYVD